MTADPADTQDGTEREGLDIDERYRKAAAMVDLSDMAVVRRHIFTANPREWPKPLLYALLAALDATAKERDEAQRQEKLWRAEWQQITDIAATLQAQLAKAEAVVTAAERWDKVHGQALGAGYGAGKSPGVAGLMRADKHLRDALATYHKTTAPVQGENE